VNAGEWHYFRVNTEEMNADEMSVNHYLAFKEKLVSKQPNFGEFSCNNHCNLFVGLHAVYRLTLSTVVMQIRIHTNLSFWNGICNHLQHISLK